MYSYGPPHMAVQKQDDQHGHTFSNYVRIRDVVQKTCLRRWTIGKSGERGSGISVLPARHDDDFNVNLVIIKTLYTDGTSTFIRPGSDTILSSLQCPRIWRKILAKLRIPIFILTNPPQIYKKKIDFKRSLFNASKGAHTKLIPNFKLALHFNERHNW